MAAVLGLLEGQPVDQRTHEDQPAAALQGGADLLGRHLLQVEAAAVVEHADPAHVVVDGDVDLVLVLPLRVLDDVRARLGEREQDVVDPVRHHPEVLQRLPEQTPHQRNALRVDRQPDAEPDVHVSFLPEDRCRYARRSTLPLTREPFVQFDVERTTVAGRPALTVRGELDIATAPQLAAAVDAQLATGPHGLVVDLTETVFMDSSGARELVRIARAAGAQGAVLHVVVPHENGPVRLTVNLLELGAVVPIVESVAEIGFGERDARP